MLFIIVYILSIVAVLYTVLGGVTGIMFYQIVYKPEMEDRKRLRIALQSIPKSCRYVWVGYSE